MAKRHPSRRRFAQQQPEDPDDLFVARVVEFTTWAKKNNQTLILLGVVLAVLGWGIVYYVGFRNTQMEEASIELETIQNTVAFGDALTARAELATFLERRAGSSPAGEARLLLAQLHLDDGQALQAITVLEAGESSLRVPVGVQIQTLLAKAHEAAGQLDVAEQIYLRVAEGAELDFERLEALDDAARLRATQGNWGGAAELYQQLLDTIDETAPNRGLYELRLAEMEERGRS